MTADQLSFFDMTGLPLGFGYEYDPRRMARATDPATSHSAARRDHTAQRIAILRAYATITDATSQESGALIGLDHVCAGRRISECLANGHLEVVTDDTGADVRRALGSGSAGRVYRLTERGRHVLAIIR